MHRAAERCARPRAPFRKRPLPTARTPFRTPRSNANMCMGPLWRVHTCGSAGGSEQAEILPQIRRCKRAITVKRSIIKWLLSLSQVGVVCSYHDPASATFSHVKEGVGVPRHALSSEEDRSHGRHPPHPRETPVGMPTSHVIARPRCGQVALPPAVPWPPANSGSEGGPTSPASVWRTLN